MFGGCLNECEKEGHSQFKHCACRVTPLIEGNERPYGNEGHLSYRPTAALLRCSLVRSGRVNRESVAFGPQLLQLNHIPVPVLVAHVGWKRGRMIPRAEEKGTGYDIRLC